MLLLPCWLGRPKQPLVGTVEQVTSVSQSDHVVACVSLDTVCTFSVSLKQSNRHAECIRPLLISQRAENQEGRKVELETSRCEFFPV